MKADRIKIYGGSCSGKTTLAIQLSNILNIPVFHIDDIFWEENWKMKPSDDFRKEIEEIVSKDRWILDGNYDRVRDIVLPRTSLIVILNTCLFVVFWRLIIRSLARRGIIRKEVTKLPKKIGQEDRMFSAFRSIFELGYHAIKFRLKRLKEVKNESIRILGKENVFVLKNKKQLKQFFQTL